MAPSASWIASRPEISLEDAEAALRRWWSLDGDLEDLPSERDRNLLVRGRDGTPTHVLKLANLDEAADFLACQDLAMARLANADVPVQRVAAAIDGRDLIPLGDPGPPLARVLTWLPGRTLASVQDPSSDLLTDLGDVMGRCATALLDFDHPAAHREFPWDVLRAPAVIGGAIDEVADPDRRTLLESVLDRLRADLVPRLSTLRRSVIHNDANDHNVLEIGRAHV